MSLVPLGSYIHLADSLFLFLNTTKMFLQITRGCFSSDPCSFLLFPPFQMWSLFGSKYGYSGYGGESQFEDTFPDGLDELDSIQCAGSANVKLLMNTARALRLAFAIFAIGSILTLQDFEAACMLPEKRGVFVTRKKCDSKWRQHLDELSKVPLTGVVEKCDRSDVQLANGYFEVYKGIATVGIKRLTRAIFDGRLTSMFCRTPPPVNLTEVKEQLRLISEGHFKNFVVCDLRHWFHQVTLGQQIKRFFGIRLTDGSWWRWKTVPMGWSWSPYICQSVAYTIILGTKFFDLPDEKETTPPRFLTRTVDGKTVAICFLLYDNILVATLSQDDAVCFHKKFEKQLKHHSVVAKSLETFTETDLVGVSWAEIPNTADPEGLEQKRRRTEPAADPPPRRQMIHLGLELGLSDNGSLRWRHDTKKVDGWRENVVLPYTLSLPLRLMARVIGIALWDNTVRMRRLLDIAPLLRLASEIGKHAHTSPQHWESTLDISQENWDLLASTIQNILCNPIASANERIPATGRIYGCSDASDHRWGALELVLPGYRNPVSRAFTPYLSTQHIFIKEFYAAIWCLKFLHEKYGANFEYVIITDNTAVAACLRRGYSSSQYCCNLLMELPPGMLDRLTVVTVKSADNPADAPSRDGIPVVKKHLKRWLEVVKRCEEEIKRFESGRGKNYDVAATHNRPVYGGVRHEEKDVSRLLEPVDEGWLVATAPAEANPIVETEGPEPCVQ